VSEALSGDMETTTAHRDLLFMLAKFVFSGVGGTMLQARRSRVGGPMR
jgi:hypothetical protein